MAIQAPEFFSVNSLGSEVIISLAGNVANGAGRTFSVPIITTTMTQGVAAGTIGYPVG